MKLAQLMRERRSVHVFEQRDVPVPLVEELLDDAVWVPNHRLTQPWRFVLVHGDGRKAVADYAGDKAAARDRDPARSAELRQTFRNRFMAVPMLLLVVMNEHPNPVVREEDYAATCCLIHSFGLLAWERGIGLVWETYPLIHDNGFRELLGVASGEKIVGSLHLGYPAKIPPGQPRVAAGERMTVIG